MTGEPLRVIFALPAVAATGATIFVAVDVVLLLLFPAEADSNLRREAALHGDGSG
jgi:hypothetical protein